MRRSRCAILTFALLGTIGVATTFAQAAKSESADVASSPLPPVVNPERAKQLQTCREGILDKAARDVDRRRWAELLLGYSSDEANALIVELLAPTQPVAVSKTMCRAVVTAAHGNPARLVPAFVDPLLELLGAEDRALREAAATAIAEFPRDGLAVRLAGIAGDEGAPLPKRLAAVDALSKNTHRREVVRQLISLLESKSPEVVAKVSASLDQASPEAHGQDVAEWRRWWHDNEQLTDEQWLEAQLRLYRQHSRRVADSFEAFKAATRREVESSVAQMRSFQSELYRALPPEQRRAKLIEWLASPLDPVRLTALGLIKSRIADEGKAPTGGVLSALVDLVSSGTAAQRRESLAIVQNVNTPEVVAAVLARLEREPDAAIRLAVIAALGHMRDPAAIPALVAVLQRESSDSGTVRAAATSLGMIAERMDDRTALDPAKVPLQERYAACEPDDVALRAALLFAMAGVADASFAPMLEQAVESDDSRLLQPAIVGLRALEDRSKLLRLRDLTANPDPPVRLAAIAAVAELGRDAEDLQSLLTRLNPAIEPNALAREAAWGGFSDYMARRPVAERIDAAKRLRETPELESRYLSELSDTLVATGGEPLDIERVRDNLARVFVAQDKYAAGAAQLRLLFQQQVDRQAESAGAVGVRWLEAALRADPPVDVGEVVAKIVAGAASDAVRAGVIDVLTRYADTPAVAADLTRTRALLQALRETPTGDWPPQWSALLQKLAARTQDG